MNNWLIFMCFLGAAAHAAPVYRWVDENGRTNYSDRPAPGAVRIDPSAGLLPGPVGAPASGSSGVLSPNPAASLTGAIAAGGLAAAGSTNTVAAEPAAAIAAGGLAATGSTNTVAAEPAAAIAAGGLAATGSTNTVAAEPAAAIAAEGLAATGSANAVAAEPAAGLAVAVGLAEQDPAAAGSAAAHAAGVAGYETLHVTRPVPEETLWGTGGRIDLALRISPSLRPGHRLGIDLDGEYATRDLRATRFQLVDVARGEHTVQAVVLDEQDREILRSSPVTFFVQQTSIHYPGNPFRARPDG